MNENNVLELNPPRIIVNINTSVEYINKIQSALDYLNVGDMADYELVYDESIAQNRAIIITSENVAHTLQFDGTVDEPGKEE
jgi:DNA polymerase III delta prime subunit